MNLGRKSNSQSSNFKSSDTQYGCPQVLVSKALFHTKVSVNHGGGGGGFFKGGIKFFFFFEPRV